jgi:hypothetical protein
MTAPILNTLYSSADAAPSIVSAASGVTTIPAGGDLVLWSHLATPYAMAASDWDPSSETGLATTAGAQMLTTDPTTAGSTLAETLPGGEMGAVINSGNLDAGGQITNGSMPLIASWTPAATTAPFANPSVQALDADVSLQVPYVEQPGSGSSVSSGQIVLYIGLQDTVSGQDLAYGLTLFDSRGNSAPYFGVDDGVGGTGAAVVTMPAGDASDLDDVVPGSAGFQGGPWTGMRDFDFEITPQTLEAAIAEANSKLSTGGTPFSTQVADYVVQNVSLDAEVEYFGQPESFAYSVGSFTVNELSTPAGQAASSSPSYQTESAATEVNTVTNGSLPETLSDAPGVDYIVNVGSGTLIFQGGGGTSTIWGGAGAETVTGGSSRVVATGGSGTAFLTGGSLGGNLLAAGAGNATLVGSNSADRDTLYGGQAGSNATLTGGSDGSILVAGAGNTLVDAGSGSSTMFGATSGGSATLVGGQTGSLMAAVTGSSVIEAGSGTDTIFGAQQGGFSTINGGASGSMIVLGAGNDSVNAGSGSDTIFMGTGNETVDTAASRSLIVQSAPSENREAIDLGSGSATVFGGVDPTTYGFDDSLYRSATTDYLVGFNPQTDRIDVGVNSIADVLATAQQAGDMTLLKLGDATVVFIGSPQLTSAMFT